MNTKAEWQTANQQLIDEQRARLGEPPTGDEILAYTQGRLSPEKEEEMRERLVAWPELARTIAEPFPPEPITRNVLTYTKALALAATVLILFGGLLWREHRRAEEPSVTWQTVPLLPDGARGPESSPTLEADGDYALVPSLVERDVYPHYRVDIADAKAKPERVVWRSRVRRRENDTLVIYMRHGYLRRGTYRLAVYGDKGTREEQLNTYTFRVP